MKKLTPQAILDTPDVRVQPGRYHRAIYELIGQRSYRVADFFDGGHVQYTWDDPVIEDLVDRFMVHVKYESIEDGGERRTAIDVYEFDGNPIAIGFEVNAEHLRDAEFAVLDMPTLDMIVDTILKRIPERGHLTDRNCVSLDTDLHERGYAKAFKVSQKPSPPTP
jgi:hypothetical protein